MWSAPKTSIQVIYKHSGAWHLTDPVVPCRDNVYSDPYSGDVFDGFFLNFTCIRSAPSLLTGYRLGFMQCKAPLAD